MPGKKNLLLGISGGIAAYKVCEIASYFTKKGVNVNVVMTEHAAEFVAPLTFEALTKNHVYTSLFDGNGPDPVAHVNLGRTADAVLIAPATANIIAKIANGIADDMVSTTVLAANCKKIIAPAMFTGMLENPATQRNLEQLRKDGWEIIESESGRLACGAIGSGRLAEIPELISAAEEALFADEQLAGKRVLVTAGATRENLDPVRFITNRSSGKMGYAIAKMAKTMGAEVTLISGKTEIRPPHGVSTVSVESAEDMYNAVTGKAADADIIIMAAAVADYTPAEYCAQKIKKSEGDNNLVLKRTKDILAGIGKDKKPGQVVVGFSMETENLLENSRKKLVSKNADMIVANSIASENTGFGVDTNAAVLIGKDFEHETGLMSKEELAKLVLEKAAEML
ncbi:MAG: bifunctional phosphopantothenoylcysteine decarboxylase/phosphopantothenate--cysteine ligase CoaBC [Oscillospiraceae bacterium]|nr:bifunctional phosphopantothenoylcysteine decarboxylase/phosphopantothenate--cysteine ligase CoaBC [Oscillospiraceae bacterium]